MATEVRRNHEEHRYEIYLDEELAGIAEYFERADAVVFPHTVIDPDLRGRGLGAELVQAALDDMRATQKRVVAQCWYVAEFIDQHPDYADLRV